jgi:hypothetical protein
MALPVSHYLSLNDLLFKLRVITLHGQQADSSAPRNPKIVFCLVPSVNKRFDSVMVRRILGLKVKNVINIKPKIMVLGNVHTHSFRILVKGKSWMLTDKAKVHHVIILFCLFISQLRKSINDDTKEHIKHDNFDHDMETCIMSQLDEVLFSLVIEMNILSNISNTSICSQAFIEHRNIALCHSLAIVFSDNI